MKGISIYLLIIIDYQFINKLIYLIYIYHIINILISCLINELIKTVELIKQID